MLTLEEIKASLAGELDGLSDQELVEVRDSIHALAGVFVDSVLASRTPSESGKKHHALSL